MTKPRRCHPNVGTTLSPPQQALTGRGCSRGCRCSPSAEKECLSTGMPGTRDSPAATSMRAGARWAQSIPNPKPQGSGVHVPTHQVKVTIVAEIVAQRVLGDVVALATHQLPVHLGEKRRGKDACGDGGTWGGHPRSWEPPQTWGHPHHQLTSHREEKQSRADARRATVKPLLLVPDAPNHHAQTLGDGESAPHPPKKKSPSVLCSQHPPGSLPRPGALTP